MKKNTKRGFSIFLILFLVGMIGGGYLYYRWSKAPGFNVQSEKSARVYVRQGESWSEVLDQISAEMDSPRLGDLRFLCKHFAKGNPKPGSYSIAPNETTRALYNKLTYGLQSAIMLTIPSKRLPSQMYKSIANQLMVDSTAVAEVMNNQALLREVGIQDSTMVYCLLPNSYEVYWTITPEDLLQRLAKEYNVFWNDERKSKAENIGLTPYEVVNLAAIVQEESNKVEEYPDIAGLYLNRLRMGMRLQADPTIKFALQDFGLRRILHEHLRVESPYNTYEHVGLPLGPIRIPDISAIDGVLNARDHKYIYMCAKSDFSGAHAFAETYSEHIKNARAYAVALNERNIK